MLVFASDLQKIKEIGCTGVDGDQVLFVCGNWVRERFHAEVFWTLECS